MRNYFILGALLAMDTPSPLLAQDQTVTPPTSKTRNFKIVMSDGLRFSPARVLAEAGEKLSFKIDNVDASDLAQILNAWGPAPGLPGLDLVPDGVIDGGDLAVLLNAWGTCAE